MKHGGMETMDPDAMSRRAMGLVGGPAMYDEGSVPLFGDDSDLGQFLKQLETAPTATLKLVMEQIAAMLNARIEESGGRP